MKMQLTVMFQSNLSTICEYTIILNQPCSFLCLQNIKHCLVLPNRTVLVAKISEPQPHELATLTTSLAREDPVIYSPVTDISLH